MGWEGGSGLAGPGEGVLTRWVAPPGKWGLPPHCSAKRPPTLSVSSNTAFRMASLSSSQSATLHGQPFPPTGASIGCCGLAAVWHPISVFPASNPEAKGLHLLGGGVRPASPVASTLASGPRRRPIRLTEGWGEAHRRVAPASSFGIFHRPDQFT